MAGARASPATPSPQRPVVSPDLCLSSLKPPRQGLGARRSQHPRWEQAETPPQPLLTALDVGDGDDSLPKLYSRLKDCWDLSMASKHTPSTPQLSPQHPSRQLKQKVAPLFFPLGENHRHDIIIKKSQGGSASPCKSTHKKKQLQVRFNLPSLCNHKAANWVFHSKVLQHLFREGCDGAAISSPEPYGKP